jgi:16S rRNA (adenine1518-N6/adenine1519-N6)-dimethyltransferase
MEKMHVEKDQHTLIGKDAFIEKAELGKNDMIVEIGAGTGNLTEELAKKARRVLAFEIDKKFEKNLEQLKSKCRNLEVVYGNALDYGWRGYNKIVSNIPFSLSEALIHKAIEDEIETMIIIVSEGFKEALLSRSKIGIISNLFFEIKPVMLLKKENFSPQPKTDCWIVKLSRKSKDNFLRRFVMRKGKIKNALMYTFVESGKTKNQAREIIKRMGIYEDTLNKPVKKATGKFLLKLEEDLKNVF